MVSLKKCLLNIIILLVFAVNIVNAGEIDLADYRHGWTYENDIWQLSIFYSRPDGREALLRFRLKEGVEKHQATYSLSSDNRDVPELLVQEADNYKPFKKINIGLSSRRRERIIVLRFAEDLSYASAYYPVILRPDGKPGVNPVINLEIFHPELAELFVHKKNIHFNIDYGPGRYAEEEFLLEVRTNFSGWSLRAYLDLLSMVQDGVKETPAISIEKFLISVNGSEAIPFRKEGISIITGNRVMEGSFFIQLFMDASLSFKAGEYTGAKLMFALE
ncbi:MAG: hypothetical protein ACHQYO_04875 [Halanaerobiales bacterium]|mgnify:CR=1 FL=1